MRFKLIVMPNGKAIVTTEENLSRAEVEQVQRSWRLWEEANGGALVATSTEVIQVKEIELEVTP